MLCFLVPAPHPPPKNIGPGRARPSTPGGGHWWWKDMHLLISLLCRQNEAIHWAAKVIMMPTLYFISGINSGSALMALCLGIHQDSKYKGPILQQKLQHVMPPVATKLASWQLWYSVSHSLWKIVSLMLVLMVVFKNDDILVLTWSTKCHWKLGMDCNAWEITDQGLFLDLCLVRTWPVKEYVVSNSFCHWLRPY